MGCNSSTSAHSPPLDAYATEKPKTPQKAINVASKLGPQRGSSDSLKAFSESALNVKLSTEKNLVLLWDGEVPSRNAYYEQAVMVLRIKGIEFTEEVVNTASPPGWYKGIQDASLPFLIWKDRSTKETSPAGRPDIKGLFKFVEDHVKHPRLFIPSCMEDTRNLGRQGLNQLDGDLHALLSLDNPLAVSKLREAVIQSLSVLDKSISERKFVGPFMFGTSISVVDVIHAPLFVRLEAAVRVRGLDIPTTLTYFSRYRDEMMGTEQVKSMVISLDVIIRHYERLAQRSAMNLPCFALQDKAVSRHFKVVITAAEAVASGKDGAVNKLVHKFNRLQTLIVCKGVLTSRIVPSVLGVDSPPMQLSTFHDRTVEEFDRVRGIVLALTKSGSTVAPNSAQDCLAAVVALQEQQATMRAESLEILFQLYRAVSYEQRWAAQRVFFGGAQALEGTFDPWFDLTPYVIEGLTAEETELYLWQAQLSTSFDPNPAASFKAFLGAISAAASRGVINETAWLVIQSRLLRHAKHAVPLTLTAGKSTASSTHARRSSHMKSDGTAIGRFNTRGSVSRAQSIALEEN